MGFGREIIRRRIVGVLGHELHVTAERDGRQHIAGGAAREPGDLGAEAQGKGDHAHAEGAGSQEVSQFVEENESSQDQDHGDDALYHAFSRAAGRRRPPLPGLTAPPGGASAWSRAVDSTV